MRDITGLVRVEIGPVDRVGTYSAMIAGIGPEGSTRIARTRQPLLDSARAFLAAGGDPAKRLAMFRAGRSEPDLTAIAGDAAKLTVSDAASARDNGPRFAPFKPFEKFDDDKSDMKSATSDIPH